MPGDPNCPICQGIGFVRQDLPITHPDFGRLQICACRQKQAGDAIQQRLYRLSNLDAFAAMSFDSFNVQGRMGLGEEQVRSLKYALNQSMQFSETLKGWLVFMGGYGCGKTHLAAAIANTVVRLGVPTLFLTVPDLLDWLRFAYGSAEANFESRFEEIRNISLLVLDDLGTQNATPWAEEKLYQIVNYRYVNHLPTVVTTNQQIGEIEGRIRSRLEDPDLVSIIKIIAPDYRTPLRETSGPVLSSLHMHANRSLGNFSMRESEKLPADEQQSLNKAFRAAQQFAERPRGWIFFFGDYGTGKTHLAAGIGNYRQSLGEAPMFVVVPDLLDHLRATFSPNSAVAFDELFNQVRTVPLLILDDLGTQSATPWAREKLYQIFNYRYNAELPTVITSALSLKDIDPRIQSRMQDTRLCSVYLLNVPSYRAGSSSEQKTRRGRTRLS